jgi:hypothetical protein
MPRIPLAVNIGSRDGSLEKDALLKNCFVEKTDNGLAVVKRPGETLSESLGSGCAQGSITYENAAIWVKSDQLWTGDADIPTLASFTALTTPTKPTSGSSVGTARAGYLVSDGTNLYSIGGRNNGDASTHVYKSINDGSSWSLTATAVWTDNLQFSNIACFFSGKIRVLHKNSSNGNYEAWSSPDGVTWTRDSTDVGLGSTTQVAFSYFADGTSLWAFFSSSTAGSGQVWKSANGVTFSSATTSPGWGGRNGPVALSLNGNLYVMAGNDGASTVYNDVWLSNTNGVTWVRITSSASWSARSYPAAWVYEGRLWIGGGSTNAAGSTFANDIYVSEDGSAWLSATSSAAWSARWRSAYAVHKTSLYIGPGTIASSIVDGLYAAVVSVTSSFTLTPAPSESCQPFQLTLIPATATTPVQVFLKNNQTAYLYNGVSVTQITDSDYPPETVPGVVYLDGSIYVMTPKGIVHGSDLAAPTSWSALNFISANAEADAAVASVRQLNDIFALKDYSIEVFYNAGNATGSPLAKRTNALLEVGLASSGSIAYTENTFYFMAQSRQKGRSIMRMAGYAPQPVSTPAVERVLNNDDLATVYSFIVKLEGHLFYVLTLGTSDITIVFDAGSGVWSQWTTLTAASAATVTSLAVQSNGTILATMPLPHGIADGDPATIAGASQAACNGRFNAIYDSSIHSTLQFSYEPTSTVSGAITGTILATFYTENSFRGAYYARGSGVDLILDKSSGAVYEFDSDVYDDNDIPINAEIRTQLVDGESISNKTIGRMAVLGDRDDTKIVVNWSDDDYQTWSVGSLINIDDERPEVRRTGRFRRRAFKIRHTEDSRLRLTGLEPIVKGG